MCFGECGKDFPKALVQMGILAKCGIIVRIWTKIVPSIASEPIFGAVRGLWNCATNAANTNIIPNMVLYLDI